MAIALPDIAILLVGGFLTSLAATPEAKQSLSQGANALSKGLAAMAEGIKEKFSKNASGAKEPCTACPGMFSAADPDRTWRGTKG